MTSESPFPKDSVRDANNASDNSSSLICDMLEQSIKSHDSNEMLINKLQKNLKLWKARYKRLLLNKSATKQASNIKQKLKRFSGGLHRNNANKMLQQMELKCRKTQQNNSELARSLADQRLETQRHYAASISYQQELQALQEGIDEAVSTKLLEMLAEMSDPLIENLNSSIEASRQQMEQLQMARSLAMALSSTAECGAQPANTSDHGDAATPTAARKGRGKRVSSPSPDPDTGALPSSPSNSSNRQCRVMPMVMGHVLQQPRLALPKMDPATLRAAAREWRQTERIENGMDMSIIAEREQDSEQSDIDQSLASVPDDNISADEEEEENHSANADMSSDVSLNDSAVSALPSVRVDLSNSLVPDSQLEDRREAAPVKPTGRFRAPRGSERLSLVYQQVQEIVSSVMFRSSDSFTASETSTHSDEQSLITDGDPLEGPSWLYSPNSRVNPSKKSNRGSLKGSPRNNIRTVKSTSLSQLNATNSDSDSDAVSDADRSPSRVRKTRGKVEVHIDDGSLPVSCNVVKKTTGRKKAQSVTESPVTCDTQNVSDNVDESILPLQTPVEDDGMLTNGLVNRESSSSRSVSLKRKSQLNLPEVVDKKRRLSKRQLSRKSVAQDQARTSEDQLTVPDTEGALNADDAVISDQNIEKITLNRLTAPFTPRPSTQLDSELGLQAKDSQKTDDSSEAAPRYESHMEVASPSPPKKRESKLRSSGSFSPSPNVMLKRFEELEKRGRRYNKSRGKSGEKSGQTSGGRMSLASGDEGNKRTRRGAGSSLLEPQANSENKEDPSIVSTSNAINKATIDGPNPQGESKNAMDAEIVGVGSSSSTNNDSINNLGDEQTSHNMEVDLVVENVMNNHAETHDSAVTATDGDSKVSNPDRDEDTEHVITKKLPRQSKKSKRFADQELPDITRSDPKSVVIATDENKTSKLAKGKETRKSTARKLSTQTKKSKQNCNQPISSNSDDITSDLDSSMITNDEGDDKIVVNNGTEKITSRKFSAQTKKAKQTVDLNLPGSSDVFVPELGLQNGHEPDNTCHFNEAMDITCMNPMSAAHDSDSVNFFAAPKNKRVIERQKLTNDTSPKVNGNSDDNVFEVPKPRGRKCKKPTTAGTADDCVTGVGAKKRNLKEKTEFDLSQMETTVLNIAPYKSAKLKENRPPQEDLDAPLYMSSQHSEASTRRLSVVLVDVLKTEPVESSPVITSPSLTTEEGINETKETSFKEPAPVPLEVQPPEHSPKQVNHSTNRKSRRVTAQPKPLATRRSKSVSMTNKESCVSSTVTSKEQDTDTVSTAQISAVDSRMETGSANPESENGDCNSSTLNEDVDNDLNDCIIDLTLSPAHSVLSFSDDEENSVSNCEIVLPPICGDTKPDDILEFIDVGQLSVSDGDASSVSKSGPVIQNDTIKATPSISVQKELLNAPVKKRGRPKNKDLPDEEATDNATSNSPTTKIRSRSIKLIRNRIISTNESMPSPAVASEAEDINDSKESSDSILRDGQKTSPRQVNAISEINSFVSDLLQEETSLANTSHTDTDPECTTKDPECTTKDPECTTEDPECTTEDPGCSTEVLECTTEAPECTDKGSEFTTEAEAPLPELKSNDVDIIGLFSNGDPPSETVNNDEDFSSQSERPSKADTLEKGVIAVSGEVDSAETEKVAAMEQNPEAAESGDGGGAPSHRRRATVKVTSYAEPKMNSKLRRGDSNSSSIYPLDRDSKKKAKGGRRATSAKKK